EPERQMEVAEQLAREPLSREVREEVIRRAAEEPRTRAAPRQEVEQIVQDVSREVRPTMVFNHRHYKAVLDGSKTQATRRRPDPEIQQGSIVRAAVNHFADLEVMGLERKRLGEFNEADARREGGYTLAEFKDYWRRVNGEWNSDDVVYLIRFRVARVR